MNLTEQQKKETIISMRNQLAIIHSMNMKPEAIEIAGQKLRQHVDQLKGNGMSDQEITAEIMLS